MGKSSPTLPTMPDSPPPAAPPAQKTKPSLPITRGTLRKPERVGLYGQGGIGKTTLVANMRLVGYEPLFIDLDNGSYAMDVARISGIDGWGDLTSALKDREAMKPFDVIVVDSLTVAQDLAEKEILRTVPIPNTQTLPEYIEDYGWGKGYGYIYDLLLRLLETLDVIAREKHVVVVMHDSVVDSKSPGTEDFQVSQPRLMHNGKHYHWDNKVKEWADHLLFLDLDKVVKDGKAQGGGSRTIYTSPLPSYWAKSRTLTEAYPCVPDDGSIWTDLFGEKKGQK